MTSSSVSASTSSHRCKQATVLADSVRRLNRLICAIDRLALGELSSGDAVIDYAIRKLSLPLHPPLVKVYSVGNTVAYAFLGDAVSYSNDWALVFMRQK